MADNASGRRWSRFALGFGAVMSIMGNETHTLLTPGQVGTPIRIVLAFIWPAGLFVAVEVLVRVNWRRKVIDYAGRVIMMGFVSIVTAVVSYNHLHGLMQMADPGDWVSAMIGPCAIDGLMIGGTVALLAIRARSLEEEELPEEEISVSQPVDPDFRAWTEELTTASPAAAEVKPRSPRARWDARRVCELAVSGMKAGPASSETGIGQSTYARYLAAARVLQDDPRAAIEPSRKVPADHVAIIRELVTK